MSVRNLRVMYRNADADDIREGKLAYSRYNQVMRNFADHYGNTLEQTTAAFCALSPNNDYYGNLRSLASVLQGVQQGTPLQSITVSTYKHCRDRAHGYASGAVSFVGTVKGLKIRSFYFNIIDPSDAQHVTIDGHMKAAYVAQRLTMKQALIRGPVEYREIVAAAKRLAKSEGLIPNQLQAIIWFARKRTERVKYDPQLDMFQNDTSDKWRTLVAVKDALPY